jgi:predicted MPP superfamily phosphohydrolase
MNKFKNINITLDTSEINKIINNIFLTYIDPKITIQEDNDNIYINNLKIIQNGDTIILNFMCNEIIKLLNANNNDKYTLTNLGFIIIDIIKKEYNNYMKRSNSLNNIEVKKFIETNESRLIFSDKDTIDDFIDDNYNIDDNDNNDDDENGFDVDYLDNLDEDEKESLFII